MHVPQSQSLRPAACLPPAPFLIAMKALMDGIIGHLVSFGVWGYLVPCVRSADMPYLLVPPGKKDMSIMEGSKGVMDPVIATDSHSK